METNLRPFKTWPSNPNLTTWPGLPFRGGQGSHSDVWLEEGIIRSSVPCPCSMQLINYAVHIHKMSLAMVIVVALGSLSTKPFEDRHVSAVNAGLYPPAQGRSVAASGVWSGFRCVLFDNSPLLITQALNEF